MKLNKFIDKLIALEMKNSECYLWCSINFQDLDLRQFFADMSDEELKHARVLTEVSKSPEAAVLSMQVPEELPGKLVTTAGRIADAIKKEKDLNKCFSLVAQLECTEVNVIYDSILKHFSGDKKANILTMNTKVHIRMLQKAAETYVTSPEVKSTIMGIEVKEKDYYRLFKD